MFLATIQYTLSIRGDNEGVATETFKNLKIEVRDHYNNYVGDWCKCGFTIRKSDYLSRHQYEVSATIQLLLKALDYDSALKKFKNYSITIETTNSEAAETLRIGIPEFIIKELDQSEKISTQGDWIQNRNNE